MDAREQTYDEQEPSAATRLWRFATTIYAKPAVARACLDAQDRWGADVNLMLYVCWCAQETRRLGPEDLRRAQARCQLWRKQVVLPLRGQRERWHGEKAYAEEYAAIKALEIQAERTQLNFLAALSEECPTAAPDRALSDVERRALTREYLQMLAQHYELDEQAFVGFQDALLTR